MPEPERDGGVDHDVGKSGHSELALRDQRGAQLARAEVSVEPLVGYDEMLFVAAEQFERDPGNRVSKTSGEPNVIVPEHGVNVVVRYT